MAAVMLEYGMGFNLDLHIYLASQCKASLRSTVELEFV